ncbi:unnamed protein product [Adineta ricciae]|uniref:Carboxylic ester hydrolase n=1 Tax=Adineta ricciae TaxID=249248 RepID=A0A815PDL0_ADIRI|nr:unnamed protein product [Adineta ricciae]
MERSTLYFSIIIILILNTISVALETRKGIINGRKTTYSMEYLGIQYAKTNRWQPPIDLSLDMYPNGSFDATSFGPCCLQRLILVWVHGGGLRSGCSSQSIPLLYNGTNIIANSPRQSIVVVTINYRLGVLGDLYLKELNEENRTEWPTSGNYFLQDILSALRWIKVNIRDFGGDKDNVLLFGESSGANAVVDLGAVKGSSNLYQHVISQSGGSGNYLYYTNMSNALNLSNEIVQNVNCSNNDSQMKLDCLRKVSFEDLDSAYGHRQTKPVIDDYFFPFYPPLAIENGNYNENLSLIFGNNNDENAFCFVFPQMNSTELNTLLVSSMGQKWVPVVTNSYRVNKCSSNQNSTNRCCDLFNSIVTDKMFDCNVRRIYRNSYLKSNKKPNVFWYHLNCNPGICPQSSLEQGAGICTHTSEIPFVFGTISSYESSNSLNCTWDNQSRIFSNQIIQHWVSIAKDGKPLSSWSVYDFSAPKYFYITPFQEFASVLWAGNCDIFDQIEREGVHELFGNQSNHIKTSLVLYILSLFVFMRFS